jgi:16S rRNA processing protein RimM
MRQINKDDCVEIGYIQKPHGLKGEVAIVFSKEFEETVEELEFLLIEIDGGLVPYYAEVEGINLKTDDSAICRLELVDSLTKAKDLVGCKIFIFEDEIIESDNQAADSVLIGMRVYDIKYGDIGLISRVDDFSGNLVITVDHPRAEVMIPLSDEVINSIDEVKREIHLSCPNGLIEIYLG